MDNMSHKPPVKPALRSGVQVAVYLLRFLPPLPRLSPGGPVPNTLGSISLDLSHTPSCSL